jgi:predicted transcriptional regulator
MKKEFIIQISDLKTSLKDFAETYEKIRKGKKMAPKRKLSFNDIDTLRKFMTGKRIELLRAISEYHPKSIKDLERLTKRDYKSINTDLAILESFDLVELQKEGNKSVPRIRYNEINIKIPMHA